jgi:hypothetical protein
MIKKLPYGGLPVVRQSGGILEYPHPLITNFATDALGSPQHGNGGTKILEDSDQSHRHFSHMHWLYPGVFHPSQPHDSNGGTRVPSLLNTVVLSV